ncbi:hypothetical protein F5887DRAFT_1163638 [Amanita rubescens]|nr:hypothetical protein F5887DRAFT_1163749 [Amanita rubescens]KAF8328955.1 hypothetical protein F5887DRAFT_1163638 [Amanita rubescens]
MSSTDRQRGSVDGNGTRGTGKVGAEEIRRRSHTIQQRRPRRLTNLARKLFILPFASLPQHIQDPADVKEHPTFVHFGKHSMETFNGNDILTTTFITKARVAPVSLAMHISDPSLSPTKIQAPPSAAMDPRKYVPKLRKTRAIWLRGSFRVPPACQSSASHGATNVVPIVTFYVWDRITKLQKNPIGYLYSSSEGSSLIRFALLHDFLVYEK